MADHGGAFRDTIFDVVSLVTSVAEVIVKPTSVSAWVGLAADALCLVTPGVTGGGAVVKAISKAGNAVDIARKIYKAADRASDIRRATSHMKLCTKAAKPMLAKADISGLLHLQVKQGVLTVWWTRSLLYRGKVRQM